MKVTKDYLTEANTMVTRRTRTELGYNSVIEKIKHSQSSYSVLSEESLIHAMDYLQGMKSTNRTSDEFVNHSRNIIEEINKTYPKQKQFKVWLRFLDIINKVQGDYSGNDDFKIGINKIFEELIDSNKGYIDWRIARKMLDVGNIFDFRGLSIKFSDILASIRKEISISEEILLFRTKSESTKLAKQYLSDLKKIIDDPNQQQLLKSAIISGRFDKKKFNLDKTMILGEDGGLYILLNRLNKSEQKMIGSIVGSDYLQDKLVNQNESLNNEVVNNDSKKKQLNIQKSDAQDFIIGKGGFGVVKFALSLINNDSDPGDIICIKKTSNFNKLKQTGGSFKPTPLERATISTMGDYFTSNIAKDIYSPNIYDMSLVTNKNYIDSAHQKGYLMMQLFPQNTATKIFVEDTSYRKWEHQKPYLVNIITTLNLMLDDNIVMTDLKPDNTLYDTGLRKASIIDLGGTVKLNSKEELYQFVRNNYSFQSTEGFIAPELSNQKPGDEPIDISKALSYSYGKLMQAVTSGVDYKPRSKMKNLIGKWVQKITNKTDYQPYYEIQTLTKKLIKEKPDERLEFEAIKHQLVAIGSDAYKDIAIYEHYINQIKTRIKKKPESISINQDILKTQKTLITQETTTLDPEEYKTLKTSNLFEKIDNFLQTENRNDQNKAFLLLGGAGTGKSIALQLKFIHAILSWEPGNPIPIYFNLANISPDSSLRKILKELDLNLKTNITNHLSIGVHLYVDSYDEGIGSGKKVNLVKKYLDEAGNNSKIIITCRSNYFNQDDDQYFQDPNGTLEKYYITPVNYNKTDITTEESLSQNISDYIEYNNLEHSAKEYINRIKQLKIGKYIKTGLDFEMLMQADIINNDVTSSYEIFNQYLSKYIATRKRNLDPEISNYIANNYKNYNTNKFYDQLAKYMASQMHIQGKVRLTQDGEYFKFLKYQADVKFSHQVAKTLLNVLPIKIEFNQDLNGNKTISVGFIHDRVKNFYLIKAMINGLKAGDNSLLASRNIVKDITLLRSIIELVKSDDELKEKLLTEVTNTKQDKSFQAITSAANAITLLVGAQHPFSGEDLSNISIKGANIRNGIFHKTNLQGADLTDVTLINANLVEANLTKAILTNIQLGINPDLIGHTQEVTAISYSPDGKYIVTGSDDETAKIWDAESGKILATLRGHSNTITAAIYSPNGKYIVTGSSDKTAKIWDAKTGEEITTLTNYIMQVLAITCSPDGKYIVTSSDDETAKIWDAESGKEINIQRHAFRVLVVTCSPDGNVTGSDDNTARIWDTKPEEELDILAEIWGTKLREKLAILNKWHALRVLAVSYSPDGKYIVTGSSDKTAKIWDAKSKEELATLKGHTNSITAVSYSPDGKYIVTGSDDNTAKIWDAKSKEELATLKGHTREINAINYSPDGKYIVTGSYDNTAKIWDAKSKEELATLKEHTDSITAVNYSPDGKYIVTGSSDKTAKIWGTKSREKLAIFKGHTWKVTAVTCSSDGKYIVTGSSDKTAKIWDAKSKEELATLKGHTQEVTAITCSLNGKYIVTGSSDNTAKIWNARSGEEVATLKGHALWITAVSYSPDGKYIVTSSYDNTAKIWDAKSKEELATLKEHTREINAVNYSPDGKYIVTGSSDKTAKIWDAKSKEELATLKGHTNCITAVSYSPDGKYIVTGSDDNTAKIWDAKTGAEITTLSGHSYFITSVSFSPNGQYIVTSSWDETAKIWDAKTGAEIATLSGHSSKITSVSFSSNGQYILTGSWDHTAKIWINKDGKWVLDREISAYESAFNAKHTKINNAINLSEKYCTVFEQRKAEIDKKTIITKKLDTYDNYDQEISSYQDNLKTKLAKEQMQLVTHLLDSNNKIKISNKKYSDSSNDTPNNNPNTFDKKAPKKSCCLPCEIFIVQEGPYVNPLMNEKDLFAKLSDVMGMNNVLTASQKLIDDGNIDLINDLIIMGNTDIDLWQDLLN